MEPWKAALFGATCAMGAYKLFKSLLCRFNGEGSGGLTLSALRKQMQHNAKLRSGLVAHRGWHYPSDDVQRPLENTLPAYERAWTAGVSYCECDVTLTTDGEIILCHDDDLRRLALNPSTVTKNVNECAFKGELEFFPLKDGSRVPKLSEVLDAAKRAGPGHKLVIEIKGEDAECARKVAKLVKTYPDQVALVMSFSLTSVASFAKENPHRGTILSLLLTTTKKGNGGHYFDLNETESALKLIASNGVDGLYLQYLPQFLTDDRFITLCRRVPIGVWNRHFLDPDNREYAEALLTRGAKFVNTDFPDRFFKTSHLSDNIISRIFANIYDFIVKK